MTQMLESDVAALRARFGGAIVTPDEVGYDAARSIWNGSIDRRPAVVARCSSASDVAEAIEFGRARGLEVSVRGGGHNFAGHGVTEGGLMINLADMKEVSVDVVARRVVCGGGATWADVDAATQAHGLALPGGVISHTGIGGLTTGGGIGWLTGKAGLSTDNLASAEVVLADGRILRASPAENQDLFWAIRGGGGNFGVVSSFEYRLHEVGPLVHLGFFFWDLAHGAEGLRFSRDLVTRLPDDMGVVIAGLNAPPAPFVPEQHRLAPGYALLVVGFGSAEQHQRAVQPVRERAAPQFELVTPMPYTALQRLLDESAPWGAHAYEKSLYLDELTDDVIRVFTEHLPQKSSPLSFVPVQLLTGAYTRVAEDETAFSGRRARGWAFTVSAIGPTADLLQADRPWVRRFWDALLPHAAGPGGYVNFMADVDEDRVRASYGSAKYDRLARLKARYDPDNVFHLNANIRPAGA
jgi:FAD/FMN-containing dehydrogenase